MPSSEFTEKWADLQYRVKALSDEAAELFMEEFGVGEIQPEKPYSQTVIMGLSGCTEEGGRIELEPLEFEFPYSWTSQSRKIRTTYREDESVELTPGPSVTVILGVGSASG